MTLAGAGTVWRSPPNTRRHMKRKGIVFLALGLLALQSAMAQVPGIINYQGRVVVNGTNFDGTGQFQFALVNSGASQTYWSNGVNAVTCTVTKGLYSILLGDTGIGNMTYAIPATVFTNQDVRLRVWFAPQGSSHLSAIDRTTAVIPSPPP